MNQFEMYVIIPSLSAACFEVRLHDMHIQGDNMCLPMHHHWSKEFFIPLMKSY